ncbi:hypothetical protein QAD02_022503 [Eretmocerus hayati]|uniref:Uncharacterized protein n=1 Tax=Eretmocerus hayati TaxID=131215 RepID=A0ACC2PSZ7_9HYME|nr:hypothetical protein QAD02_022503 [Eretmocerus hayati]
MNSRKENKQYIHNPSAPLTNYVIRKLKRLDKTGQLMVNSAMEEEEVLADQESNSNSDSDSESEISSHHNMCHGDIQSGAELNESFDDDSRTSERNITQMETSIDTETENIIQCDSSESRDCTLDSDEGSSSDASCDQASSHIMDTSYTDDEDFDRPYDINDARDDGLYSSDEEFDCNAEFRRFGYDDNNHDAKLAEKKLFQVIQTQNTLSPACVLRLVLQFSFSNDVCFSGIVSLAHMMNLVVGQRMLPDTRYLFDRLCGAHPPHILHAVCPNCSAHVGEFMEEVVATCSRCSLEVDLSNRSKSCFFAIVDPSDAVRDYIQTFEDYYDYVVKFRVHDPKHIRDVYDSKLYRDFLSKLPPHYRSNRYPYEDNPRPMKRNEKKHIVCAKKALETGLPCLGVRFLSPLVNLLFFKIIDGLCPEYMHQYLAGCGKQITKCILRTLKPAARSLIDEYMKKMRVPTQIGRLVRILSLNALYKCKEWENWVLYYSIPVLSQVITDDRILKHWALLVDSLHVILRSDINREDLEAVRKKLEKLSGYIPDIDPFLEGFIESHYLDFILPLDQPLKLSRLGGATKALRSFFKRRIVYLNGFGLFYYGLNRKRIRGGINPGSLVRVKTIVRANNIVKVTMTFTPDKSAGPALSSACGCPVTDLHLVPLVAEQLSMIVNLSFNSATPRSKSFLVCECKRKSVTGMK